MQIKILAEGGSLKPSPALSQKLGPIGIPLNQVIQKVNDATKNFSGLKVPVTLEIDVSTKNFDVVVSSPPVGELIKKELGIQKGSGKQKEFYAGNASIEQLISVAKQKQANLLSKDLKSSLLLVVGSCVSLGVLIENKSPKEITLEIIEGKFDNEIKAESTQTSFEKKKQLDAFFSKLKDEQDKKLRAQTASEQAAAAKGKTKK